MAHALEVGSPKALAACRRAGSLLPVRLDALASRAEAEAFQAAAIRALDGAPCGYKIGATSVEVQHRLGCQGPIYSPIMSEDLLESGATFRIPAGFLGVECEFGFRMGRDFSGSSIAALRSAIAECFVGLELVGRRVSAEVPLNEVSAIADFGLDVAVVRGQPIADWERQDLATLSVRAVVDGITVASSNGAAVLGHPLNALLWLAKTLRSRGDGLRSGEIVLTGTCTGITKLAPGQKFAGFYGDLPPVQLHLT